MTGSEPISPDAQIDSVERDGETFILPAELIAQTFGLTADRVPALMRDGSITSRCEAGVDTDAGRWRITMFYHGRAMRVTVDATGLIIGRANFPASGLRRKNTETDRAG